jgi:hypothetical protein
MIGMVMRVMVMSSDAHENAQRVLYAIASVPVKRRGTDSIPQWLLMVDAQLSVHLRTPFFRPLPWERVG